jgi:uncharacterized protein involved in outer membrane biogenesis
MKNPRKTLILTLLVLVAAGVVLAGLLHRIAGRHRDSAQQELQKLLGQEVRFASFEVHLWGWPGFAAKDLRIADDPRFAATPILRAGELVLGIQLWPLLFGRVMIDSLTLREPELQIITDETGRLNINSLTRRNKELAPLPKIIAPPSGRKTDNVNFALATLRIDHGRVIYLDRSVKEPAELQLRSIDMTLHGLDAMKATQVRLSAALAEGLGQDVHIEGELDPVGSEQAWLERAMHLNVRLDSLHVPVVARAITWLRDKLPTELDVTGPMSLQATAAGTLARPRLENIILNAPLFGSSDYNAVMTGAIEFSERRTWEDAQLKGRLKIDPLPIDRLRDSRWFRQHLSPALVTDGTIGVYGQFEGTWETLRIGALVRADKSDWRYKEWLRKPLDRPAELRTRVARQKNKFFFHESELVSGANRVGFNGFVDTGKTPKLQLRLHNSKGLVTEWRELFAHAGFVGVGGQTEFNIVIERYWLPDDDSWSVDGYFKLRDGVFTHASGSKIDEANGAVTFAGQQAKFNHVRFRLGDSVIVLDGIAPNILAPDAAYQLHSTQLTLADLPLLGGKLTGRLNRVSVQGTAQFHGETLVLDGNVIAPNGQFADFDFRDLRAKIAWSGTELTFQDLSLRTLDGTLRAEGYIAGAGDNSGTFELEADADAFALGALSRRFLPFLGNRIQGRLDGHGQLAMIPANGNAGENALTGKAETTISHGTIKDFNLVSQLLLRGSGATVSSESVARLPPGFASLLAQRDTIIDSLKANVVVEAQRIRTDNLVLATADYTLTGAGWIGFDRSTKWNGLLVLSPKITQEVQKDYRSLRYLLDRRGRLAITFGVEGEIPNARIRLDNRALAQTLRGGAPARDGEGEAQRQQSEGTDREKKWLPDALDRFLNR